MFPTECATFDMFKCSRNYWSKLYGHIVDMELSSLLPRNSGYYNETGLIIPYLSKLNRMGFITEESQPVQVEEGQKNVLPAVSGLIGTKQLENVKRDLDYIDITHDIEYKEEGNEQCFEQRDEHWVSFVCNQTYYNRFTSKGQDPFWDDLIKSLERTKDVEF